MSVQRKERSLFFKDASRMIQPGRRRQLAPEEYQEDSRGRVKDLKTHIAEQSGFRQMLIQYLAESRYIKYNWKSRTPEQIADYLGVRMEVWELAKELYQYNLAKNVKRLYSQTRLPITLATSVATRIRITMSVEMRDKLREFSLQKYGAKETKWIQGLVGYYLVGNWEPAEYYSQWHMPTLGIAAVPVGDQNRTGFQILGSPETLRLLNIRADTSGVTMTALLRTLICMSVNGAFPEHEVRPMNWKQFLVLEPKFWYPPGYAPLGQ